MLDFLLPIRLAGFVAGRPLGGHAIAFVGPRTQIDQPAALAAKWPPAIPWFKVGWAAAVGAACCGHGLIGIGAVAWQFI